ncbi:MAG: SPOR domain-containing protein [Gallionella sp.]
MRKLFWILLLANAMLFAGMQRGWLGFGEQEPQAQPALNPGKIRLLDATQILPAKVLPAPVRLTPAASAPVEVTTAPAQITTAPAPSSNLQMTLGISAPAPGSHIAPACLEWGDFSGPDLARATAALSALQLGDKLSRRQVEQDIGYWVYIPPLKNRAAMNRKIAELKALGVTEYFVVQGAGHWQNAISLGVFKSRDAAQNFLNYLHSKGVHTAKVGERASKLKTTIFKLNRIDAPTLEKLTAMQKDFAGSELKNVPCTISGIH